MEGISVTIGIPVYLVEDVIRLSFESALSQTYENIDYIVVDDCGSDNSIEIVKKIIDNHQRKTRVKIIRHKDNLGLGEARNTIINNSNTDYVYFMDSDDCIEPNTIEILVNKAQSNSRPDIIIANHVVEHLDGKIEIAKSVESDVIFDKNIKVLDYYSKNNIRISSWNKLYRRVFLLNNGIRYVNRYHEDYYFSLQELYYANSVLIIPNVLYHYILRSQSITSGMKMKSETVDRLILVISSIYEFIVSHDVRGILYNKRYVDMLSYIAYIAFATNHPQINNIYSTLCNFKIDRNKYNNSYVSLITKLYLYCFHIPSKFRPIYLNACFYLIKFKRCFF